ncbi:MAG: histone deacetylase, partial [Planctomycetaceae bacterium]
HHGNGTQDCFYDEELVYFMSSHRDPFYPGTGAKRETGTGDGLGTIFNLPTNFGITRDRFINNFRGRVEEAAEACRPELVLISAGFDAHKDDPIGSLGLESEDFATLTNIVMDIADTHCNGRIVSLLEGGYNVDALADCVEIHLRSLIDR